MKFLVIDGCPCPAGPAPYIALILERAKQTANAIYRGDDPAAVAILHAHGKHTQRELYNATPAQRKAWGVEGIPNRPGFSQHELFSDGHANPHVPAGQPLKGWRIGVDSQPKDGSDADALKARRAIEAAARHYGWHVHHPYGDNGLEGHHWCFVTEPHAHGPRQLLLIWQTRRALRRNR